MTVRFWQNEDVPNNGHILVGGANRKIRSYSIRNALLDKEMLGHTDSVTCMAADGNLLFTGSEDCTIRQWELTMNTPSGLVGRHDSPI